MKTNAVPPESDSEGCDTSKRFECEDIHQTHEELVGKGVKFPDPPRKEFWGWWGTFEDPDGNTYGLGPKGQ